MSEQPLPYRKLPSLADIGSDFPVPTPAQKAEQIIVEARRKAALIYREAYEKGFEEGLRRAQEATEASVSQPARRLVDFEDLRFVEDSTLLMVLRLVDIEDMALALKGANRELCESIYRHLSPEMNEKLSQRVDDLGQVPWEDVLNSQHSIRDILQGFLDLGKARFR